MKVGIAEWCLSEDISVGLDRICQLGCVNLHLDVGLPDDYQWLGNKDRINYLLAIRKQFDIEFTAISVNALCDYKITQRFNTGESQIAWSATQVAIDAALIMQIPLVSLPSFEKSEIFTDIDFKFTQEFLKFACEYGEQKGIKIASENNLGIEKQRKLINDVNMPNFWLFFDTYNPCAFGHDPVELWRQVNPWIYPTIHVKDGLAGAMGCVLLGNGEAPLQKIFSELKNCGFNIDLIIETDYPSFKESLLNLLEQDIQTIENLWLNG